jgi:peptide methionine sulfoxide reductase msrA/msrB
MKKIQLFYLFIFSILLVLACNQKILKEKNNNMTQITKSDAEWKAILSPEEYYVLREKGTERPFTGKFLLHSENGFYTCRGCGNRLFKSDSKFESHCGWPSFDKEIAKGTIIETQDISHGMVRTEITCGKCGGHLGHVFNDGPTETGLRYCVNSLSLSFEKEEKMNNLETITLAGGCFWCIEAVYNSLEGVESVESGYAGGTTENPTYKEVCNGNTNHAEVVHIKYNPSKISFEEILKVFFTVHDPAQLNRQGADIGTQSRSAIFYKNEQEKSSANSIIEALNQSGAYSSPIVTTLEPFTKFYKAEEYHQGYFRNNPNQPYCEAVVRPKVEKFEKVFKDKLKKK